jgi:hypothetical protein
MVFQKGFKGCYFSNLIIIDLICRFLKMLCCHNVVLIVSAKIFKDKVCLMYPDLFFKTTHSLAN